MKTQSLVWGKAVLGDGSNRIFSRGLLLVAACVLVSLVAPNSRAQERGTLTDAAQKRTQAKAAKKLPRATKKSVDGKKTANAEGCAEGNARKLSLSDTKKPTGGKAGALTTAGGSTKESKTPAKKNWQSTCGKDKHGAATATNATPSKATGTKQKVTPPARGRAPKLVVEKLEISKEPVWYGEMIECEWVLKNEGDVNLSITARGG